MKNLIDIVKTRKFEFVMMKPNFHPNLFSSKNENFVTVQTVENYLTCLAAQKILMSKICIKEPLKARLVDVGEKSGGESQ